MKPKKQIVSVYLDIQAFRELRSLLILEGTSVSAWLRKQIEKYLKKHKKIK